MLGSRCFVLGPLLSHTAGSSWVLLPPPRTLITIHLSMLPKPVSLSWILLPCVSPLGHPAGTSKSQCPKSKSSTQTPSCSLPFYPPSIRLPKPESWESSETSPPVPMSGVTQSIQFYLLIFLKSAPFSPFTAIVFFRTTLPDPATHIADWASVAVTALNSPTLFSPSTFIQTMKPSSNYLSSLRSCQYPLLQC